MSIFIRAGSALTELGTNDFVHAFFSTISYHLEKDGWGSRFPTIMNELYQGELKKTSAKAALAELKKAQKELAKYSPKDVIWDIEDLKKSPPWGDQISPEITAKSIKF